MKALGLMSGTSMDGIDAALLETDGQTQISVLDKKSLNYPPAFTHLLKATEYAAKQAAGDESVIRERFSQFLETYIKNNPSLVDQFSKLFGSVYKAISYDDVIELSTDWHQQLIAEFSGFDFIAYHGQTLFHQPKQLSLQIGNAQHLAEQFQCPVVNQFRLADINAGGQGAPLAPIYHYGLATRDQLMPLAVVNCGGIANITLMNRPELDGMIGFDTGPGNVLIDRYIRTKTNEKFDKDGQYGRQGKCQPALLLALNQHACRIKNYSQHPHPKSLDSNDFVLIPECQQFDFYDVCHTLAVFTAHTIIDSVLALGCELPRHWVLAGGGWKNPIITEAFNEYLSQHIDPNIQLASELNWDGDYLEAELMAYLGVRRLNNLPITFPNTTGVSQPLCGGEIVC